MNITEYADADLMAVDVASILAGELRAALALNERVTFCVPGGTTPGPVFDDLCDVHLDWSRVDVVLSDERWVPETSPRSNTRLLGERLLVRAAAAAHLVPLYADAPTPEEKLPGLAFALGPLLPIDVLLLGMGDDMHTASLFPGADRLEEAFDDLAPLLLPMRASGAQEPRITLTAPVLKGAMSTHIIIKGQSKLEAIRQAKLIDNPLVAPVSAFLNGASVHWANK
jgi:6-phosphogluconolactonase